MQIQSVSIEDYISKIPEEIQEAFKKLFDTVNDNLPKGFEDAANYGMIGWVVPLAKYPAGYHCAPGTPLPFINIASQKNFIALYHMGLYSTPELLDWFVTEYPKHSKKKLDMGKSCVRFKKAEDIPFELIAELSKKMTADDWIKIYESQYRR